MSFMLARKKKLLAAQKAVYVPNAVVFDGTNDYLERTTNLSGVSDGGEGMLSVWLKPAADNSSKSIFFTLGSAIQFIAGAQNQLRCVFFNASLTAVFWTATPQQILLTANGWHHVLVSWKTNLAAGSKIIQVYVNDAGQSMTIDIEAAGSFNTDYTNTMRIGANGAGPPPTTSTYWNGEMAEFYFNTATRLDLSNSVNRRKFISAAGKPVSLGANGELPTGSQPAIYLKSPAASFGTNSGSGGDFTITGSLGVGTPP